jgi:ATP-dependent Lon protease
MATALASLMTGVAVRGDVAMTGEITLRGKVLPIGGLKEKVLAAFRFGTKTVIFPRDNERDLSEIPDDIKKTMTFHLVDNMDEVLDIALVGPLPGAALGDRTAAADAASAPADGPVTH